VRIRALAGSSRPNTWRHAVPAFTS
jgi:hypothetical protein